MMTQLHRKLVELLEELHLQVEIEKAFTPYSVDVYLPRLHVVIEADGPQHKNHAKDALRDGVLRVRYGLPVYRVTEEQMSHGGILKAVLSQEWLRTAGARKDVARAGGWMDE